MNLFSPQLAEPINVLPCDGEANYFGEVMPEEEAQQYFLLLLKQLAWRPDQAMIFGKLIETKRKVAWYADTQDGQPFNYTYSNITKQSLPFTKELLVLKALVEENTGESYNSCLANLYHGGEEGMAWHSDGETDLKRHGAIASLSFGASRKFAFKHKANQNVIALPLHSGSLLVMKGITQEHWFHRLPPTKTVVEARINLTFRTIVNDRLV